MQDGDKDTRERAFPARGRPEKQRQGDGTSPVPAMLFQVVLGQEGHQRGGALKL
jgi:hypothetical protein